MKKDDKREPRAKAKMDEVRGGRKANDTENRMDRDRMGYKGDGKKNPTPKKGIEVKIEAKPVKMGDMSKREAEIRKSAGEPDKGIMPMRARRP